MMGVMVMLDITIWQQGSRGSSTYVVEVVRLVTWCVNYFEVDGRG